MEATLDRSARKEGLRGGLRHVLVDLINRSLQSSGLKGTLAWNLEGIERSESCGHRAFVLQGAKALWDQGSAHAFGWMTNLCVISAFCSWVQAVASTFQRSGSPAATRLPAPSVALQVLPG